ncbi:winged helix-turn-helix transcriptional regulator [Agrobacterium rubi]|uniref:ArsR/SmtB family transcription factor n=1 Tax=Agrobacterium rubi TaxID=28099 RepID=UPI001574E9A3|nr:metalloregulator ArsR/SmtB family transcription factor [Agrobacterium rubi]NTF10698.1 winged helix-turn-helix transcriptional regulator [Agrobacterium rubi]NTF23092.1 winged helix-turn-helix transcriptional regulator [Agrobacterium rubi]NTF30023.1 winged helix-turn-helix transcriptional regulator [Agrobacterium rubi]
MTPTPKTLKPVDLMTAMANEHRLDILRLLLQQEINVRDLADRIGLSQSALSQHLAKLRAFNLVQTRRDAQTVYYSSRHRAVRMLIDCLDAIESEPPQPGSSAACWIMK